jgi:hypothetical protein
MNKGQFQQLKQYVGSDLLNYILNYDQIIQESNYEQLELLPNQVLVLDDLHEQIQQCRIQFIAQGGYGDGVDFYLRQITVNGTSLFNHYRQICGGQFASPTSADPLIWFLQEVCIREYPNLLMKPSKSSGYMPLMDMTLGMENFNEFIRLVKNDVLDQITNKKDDLEYAFQFTTSDDLGFYSQVYTTCSTIISRSFYNACNRMDYSLPSVLRAIEENIEVLRQLANGQRITYSSFIGIRGLQFQGFEEIEFSGSVLRQFRDTANPGMHTARTVVRHSTGAGEYSGHILEVFHSTEISSISGNANTGNSTKTNQAQETELQKLRFAIVFSSLANRGFVPTFYEVGFPLISPGNYGASINPNPGNYILIDEATKVKLVDWYKILSNKDLQQVRTPLKRLQYAIFERSNPEDAIVDAIIAWEGMFSEAFETTFKVTASMAKFLRSGAERKTLFVRLQALYKLRSDLVHGKSSKLLKKENISDVRAEVIKIGLECLIKIINNDRLLSMDSEERIKTILVFDDPDDVPTQLVP